MNKIHLKLIGSFLLLLGVIIAINPVLLGVALNTAGTIIEFLLLGVGLVLLAIK